MGDEMNDNQREKLRGIADNDAISMILSANTDFGHTELGGMVSVKKFGDVTKDIEWFFGTKKVREECRCCETWAGAKRYVYCPDCGNKIK
jgi:Zn finger protein HypA/HybF involved in hydrogenase expression